MNSCQSGDELVNYIMPYLFYFYSLIFEVEKYRFSLMNYFVHKNSFTFFLEFKDNKTPSYHRDVFTIAFD